MKEDFVINNGSCHISEKSCRRNSHHMLPVMDWMSDIPCAGEETDLVEVQFKNTRKGYYHNINHLPLEKGVVVIVDANPGYDMGEVTLTGRLVPVQIKKSNINLERYLSFISQSRVIIVLPHLFFKLKILLLCS